MSWLWHRGSGRAWKAVKHWIAPGSLSTWVQLRRALLTTTSQLCSLSFIRRLSIGFLCCFQTLLSGREHFAIERGHAVSCAVSVERTRQFELKLVF
jgi:hypothetical protein